MADTFIRYAIPSGTFASQLPITDGNMEVHIKNDNSEYIMKIINPSSETTNAINASSAVIIDETTFNNDKNSEDFN